MFKNRFENLFYFLTLVGFCLVLQNCSGGHCAANSSVLEDIDSDCVADSSDNCVFAEDPGSSYNPEQFDGDEDGIGVPCDADDTDDTNAGVGLIRDEAFNMGGDYEFTDASCFGVSTLTIEQNRDAIRLQDADYNAWSGTAELSDDGALIGARVNLEDAHCELLLDVTTNVLEVSCLDSQNHTCSTTAVKTSTSLWSDF